ncbi:MAG: ATPase [Chlorobi bacterium]|nr:ATPase [Chlorobiota bacterium]
MIEKLYAVPTVNGAFTQHFGHCEKFAIIKTIDNKVISEQYIEPPEHQPGSYPAFLVKIGVNTLIAGGIGQTAIDLFTQNKIEVLTSGNEESPWKLVEQHLNSQLSVSKNQCDN